MTGDGYQRLWLALAPRPEDHKLDGLIDGLSEREAQIVRLRFGMSGSRPRTIEETCREVAEAETAVRAMEASALRKLRRKLGTAST